VVIVMLVITDAADEAGDHEIAGVVPHRLRTMSSAEAA